LARGDTDACGRGCNEWIAAEGKIDLGAAQRLRRLLAKLGRRRPPIFFHSGGGSITGSIELGRAIRDQKLEVNVAYTIPRGCDRDKPLDKSCKALKRSGQELEAEFDPAIYMCNSGCVWAFAGGTTRFVPPWVKLGIHDVGLDPEKTLPRGASLAQEKRVAHAHLLEYVRDMGIDIALLAASSAVPYESPRFLDRDELVRFGIDRRDFGETRWHFADKPTVAMSKRFFVRTDSGDQPRYRNGLVRLDCGVRQEIRLAFAQQHDSSGQKSADPVVDVNGQRIVLPYQIPSRAFDVRSASLSAEMFDFVGHGANIKVSGIDQGRNDELAGSITLNMDGFSDASVKLRKSCDESARNAVAVAPGTGPAVLSPTAPNSLTDPKHVPTVTIRSDQAEQKRIALRSGETTDLYGFWSVTNCRSNVVGNPEIEVLEGPAELTLALRAQMIVPRRLNCASPVPGGMVVATVKDVAEPAEAKLIFRIKFKTKDGNGQETRVYIVSLFP
jgi:hypothetical protein